MFGAIVYEATIDSGDELIKAATSLQKIKVNLLKDETAPPTGDAFNSVCTTLSLSTRETVVCSKMIDTKQEALIKSHAVSCVANKDCMRVNLFPFIMSPTTTAAVGGSPRANASVGPEGCRLILPPSHHHHHC